MTQPRKNQTPPAAVAKNFIALDGEAIDGHYVLLGTSHPSYQLENRHGITTKEALDFLFRLGHNRLNRKNKSVFVGYFFGYDVEMICKDLPLNIKRRLFRPKLILTKAKGFRKDRVYWRNWELTYIKNKYFSVKRRGAKHGITIYDVSGFFTGFPSRKFVSVLQQMKIRVPQSIVEGKAARQDFTWANYATIKAYNHQECHLLVKLMNKIYRLCDRQGLVPQRWYGSSAVGNKALRQWRIGDYMRRTVQHQMSGYFWDAITTAFFGGRIEAFKLGTLPPVWAYDINSAYPAAIALLPATKDNRWEYTRAYRPGFGVWRCRFKFPKDTDIGVLPYRMAGGSIKFPLQGEGWYWNPEIELALKYWPTSVEILDGYYLTDETKPTPFQTLFPALFKRRARLKARGDMSHYIIKIVLNSIYGKFSQKVGRADFKNFTWAGWITSYTRARLREAVIGHENQIVAFSTDGIYSLAPLRKLKASPALGGWDVQKFVRGTILMSGVYLWETAQGDTKVGERGYEALSDWDGILGQLNERRRAEVAVRLFVGFNMADHFPAEYRQHYLKFYEVTKELNPYQLTKRKYHTKQIKDWRTDFCDSEPLARLDGPSQPIKTVADFWDETDLVLTAEGEELGWVVGEEK